MDKENQLLIIKSFAEFTDKRLGKRLYTDYRFHTPNKKAQFVAHHTRGLAEPANPEYPLILTTGRLYGHWHTLTRTGRIPKIQQMHPQPFIEIHPKDARQLGIASGDLVGVKSVRGQAQFPALVTEFISPGTVFVPMHWGELWADQAEANVITHGHACPDSKQPELKACAVNLTKLRSPLAPAPEVMITIESSAKLVPVLAMSIISSV